MDDLQKRIADAIEPELDKREMIDAAPSVIRRLQAERIARTVLAIPEIAEALFCDCGAERSVGTCMAYCDNDE